MWLARGDAVNIVGATTVSAARFDEKLRLRCRKRVRGKPATCDPILPLMTTGHDDLPPAWPHDTPP